MGFRVSMIFAYLDEFGHNGPYVSRNDKRYNTSPVFGLAGFLMPEARVRSFGTCFLQLKQNYLAQDPTRQEKPFHEWEKKGTNFFTAKSITKYPAIRECMFRLIKEINARDGKIIYQGREKIRGDGSGLNPNGLYTTIFSDMIRAIDEYCETIGENFVIVLDQNSVRNELLVTASKTMYGARPTRRMICPPFEVESHLNQQVQAADWIATIKGRIWNSRLDQTAFNDMALYDTYFSERIAQISTNSEVKKRRPPKPKRALKETALGSALTTAGYQFGHK
ncbi:DUF3800 domain-containing protein (plasmid) [Thioclava sp. 'Guangxiensis']|uniref:DUF3800 domain-containing protein n=1 Tax=Thioclava sp. 'Guangxiensis' TaxID=3149044 RepID=UPI003877A316